MVKGIGLVVPRLMTHCGKIQEGEMNEGGKQCWFQIGGRMVK